MFGQIKNPSFIEGLLGVPTTGLEPVAYGLEIRCSIQLSYVGIFYKNNPLKLWDVLEYIKEININ